MQINTAASNPQLTRQFMDLKSSLDRLDTDLSNWQRNGATYPAASVAGTFQDLAFRMSDARDALRDTHPRAIDITSALQNDTLHIARLGGKVERMAATQSTFGAGWSTALDSSIHDASRAVDLLLGN